MIYDLNKVYFFKDHSKIRSKSIVREERDSMSARRYVEGSPSDLLLLCSAAE